MRGGGFTEFDVEFRFAKIQNSHLWGGGVAEFDVEFRFAKIQNSHLWGGGGVSVEFAVESDLLKSKLPFVGGGGGFMEFDVFYKTFLMKCQE